MTSLAEVAWSPANKRNWDDFRKRLNTQFKRFGFMGVNFSKGSWKVDIVPKMTKDGKRFRIKMETETQQKPKE